MRLKQLFFSTFLLISMALPGCQTRDRAQQQEEEQIATLLDQFNQAAAAGNFEAYFGFFAADAIFIGTDGTERWNKKDFMQWSKPYFDRGKAWDFTSIERHISFSKSGEMAWFDELLETQMKLCRGSGVLEKDENGWKITQYVLSMTIPNSLTDTVVSLKSGIETKLIEEIKLTVK
ncbi:MAG: nuclear transport factor 2 family protein [Bacteroidales bacterium]|nr:nuclear transport factor 2 family protein [Bacteroidales bacterium]